MVSIARALSQDAQLIIMDEPSAVLDNEEVERLFGVIRDLTAHDVAVVYISHRLEEIRQIGDRITVLKDGRTVATGLPARETSDPRGHHADDRPDDRVRLPAARTAPQSDEAPLLEVDGPGPARHVRDVVRGPPGEIVGLAGLVGSGRSEILETVYGARRATAGTVRLAGQRLRRRRRLRGGRRHRPRPRGAQEPGAAARRLRLPQHHRLQPGPLRPRRLPLRRRREGRGPPADRGARRPPRRRDRIVRTLSGGNQQKVVLARWLLRDCRVLLLDEPTRGVDVGARSEIYALVRDLADRGVAVVVVSSEIPEVLGLADRVLVIADGAVVAEAPADALDEHRVLDLVMEGTAAHRHSDATQRTKGTWHERDRDDAGGAAPAPESGNGAGFLAGPVGRNLGLVIALAILCIVGVDHRR